MPLSSHSTSVQLLSCKLEFNSSLSVDLIIFPSLLLIIHFHPARTKKMRKKQASKGGCFLSEKLRVAFVFMYFFFGLFIRALSVSLVSCLCAPRKPVQACSVKLPVSCATTRAPSSIERESFAKKGHLLGKEDLLMYKHLLASVPAFRAWRNVLKKSRAARLEKGSGPPSWLSCSLSKMFVRLLSISVVVVCLCRHVSMGKVVTLTAFSHYIKGCQWGAVTTQKF